LQTDQFTLDLSFLAADFQQEWRRCSLAANYIAAYAAYQFERRERMENLISTIANEMLETAVRLAPPQSDLQMRCVQLEDGLRLDSSHRIRGEAARPYLALLEQLQDGRQDELYLELLTSEQDPADYFNQLGLTMIAHDFGARLTAQLKEQTDRIYTEVFIPIEELSA
jgi:hypothetical protein